MFKSIIAWFKSFFGSSFTMGEVNEDAVKILEAFILGLEAGL